MRKNKNTKESNQFDNGAYLLSIIVAGLVMIISLGLFLIILNIAYGVGG